MVQAQYTLVHDALCEVIQCGNTEISAARLGAIVDAMTQSLPGETVNEFEQQFQVRKNSFRPPSFMQMFSFT